MCTLEPYVVWYSQHSLPRSIYIADQTLLFNTKKDRKFLTVTLLHMHKMLSCLFQGALINVIIFSTFMLWKMLHNDSVYARTWSSKHFLAASAYKILWQACPTSLQSWPNSSYGGLASLVLVRLITKWRYVKCLHLSQSEVGLNIHRNKMWELLYLTIR